jgi:hypothetical protein
MHQSLLVGRDRNSLNVIANNATFGLVTAVEKMGYKLEKVRFAVQKLRFTA